MVNKNSAQHLFPLSGEEIYGKGDKRAKKVTSVRKKKSIFFELEYWKYHHVRHYIDVMHVEKNVCDNLLGTLLNLKFKTKDSVASRLDLVEMGIRADLAPQIGEKKTFLPPAPYSLSRAEKKKMLSSLSSMKLPYGHSLNIKNCVSMDDLKVYGLKSHDCHALLQQLLSVAIRSVLPRDVLTLCARKLLMFRNRVNCNQMLYKPYVSSKKFSLPLFLR